MGEPGIRQCQTLLLSLEVSIIMTLMKPAPVLITILEHLEPQVTVLRVVDPTPRPHPALPIIPRTILPINHLPHHTRVPHLPKVMFQLLLLQEAALISHRHPLVMLLPLLA